MGLLGKAAGSPVPRLGIRAVIENYHAINSFFHCIVLEAGTAHKKGNLCQTATAMLEHLQPACEELAGGNCMVLIPGCLDRELFAHRLSGSTGSAVLFQCSAGSAELVIEAVQPYIQ
ncbi:MAG: hypothetical protein LBD48_00415 [Treponema sp.]|jgi:hypothetical protein|nr:hypothetical protein [Treponema sp.]